MPPSPGLAGAFWGAADQLSGGTVPLTDTQARKAAPQEKDYKLADSGGLYLLVTKAGFKSWRLKYLFAGKEKRLVFGSSSPDAVSARPFARTRERATAPNDNAAGLSTGGVPAPEKVG